MIPIGHSFLASLCDDMLMCVCVCLLSKACNHKCGPWNEEIFRSVCGAEPSLLLLISCVSCFTPLLRIRIKSDKDAALPHACMQRVKCLQVPNAPTAPEAYLFLVKNAQSFVHTCAPSMHKNRQQVSKPWPFQVSCDAFLCSVWFT